MYIIKHLHLTIKRKNTMQDKESFNGREKVNSICKLLLSAGLVAGVVMLCFGGMVNLMG